MQSDSQASVAALWTAPVKGLRVQSRASVQLDREGVIEDRRFYLIDERGRMRNGKQLGELTRVIADYEHAERRLTMMLPDGSVLSEAIELGEQIETRFYSRQRTAWLVRGPWAVAISELAGQPLRLVEPVRGSAVDRGRRGAASIISRGSLERLAAQAPLDAVDSRRFRMLIELEGLPAHGEDRWVGHRVRVGGALLAVAGHVGRCLITSRDPQTGTIDLPTLDLLGDYRSGLQTTEPLPFGVYGSVVKAGQISVGDAAAPIS